jgi:hypothetical protein
MAAFLADLVLSPLIFIGSALLYLDQKARFARKESSEPESASSRKTTPARCR